MVYPTKTKHFLETQDQIDVSQQTEVVQLPRHENDVFCNHCLIYHGWWTISISVFFFAFPNLISPVELFPIFCQLRWDYAFFFYVEHVIFGWLRWFDCRESYFFVLYHWILFQQYSLPYSLQIIVQFTLIFKRVFFFWSLSTFT